MDALTQAFIQAGELLPDENAAQLQLVISTMLGQHDTRFPGSQPVSLEPRRDLAALLNEDFCVCEKTDGTRFLFYMSLEQWANVSDEDWATLIKR